MADESKRYFTVEEVERLIPRLDAAMGRVKECHAEVSRLRTALGEAQRRVMLAGGVRLDQEFWRSAKSRLGAVTGELQEKIGEILGLGGVPKDLELGLVDFPALIDEREVNLCWRLGERRIRFWHGLDEGFAARKPLPGAR
ncbi:MAG TPA: DUF2203 domain-containing protein [Methylomirabilota bacterium]|nr:DUF2203 domain-containing protein [Methylomirabilota bacterium]